MKFGRRPFTGAALTTRCIRKGTRIIEYTGERLTPSAADARYDDDRREQPHVLLFTVDRRTVIDAGVGGNEARYFNHSVRTELRSGDRAEAGVS